MVGNPNFVKGNNLGGRTKGSENKVTTKFKEALNKLFEDNSDKMAEWLEQIDAPEKRFDILTKFAEYLYPKLARQEHSGIDGAPIEHDMNMKVQFVGVDDDKTSS